MKDGFDRGARMPGWACHEILPSQVSSRAKEDPIAELALTCIVDAVLIAMGHKHTVMLTLGVSRVLDCQAQELWRETQYWLFVEGPDSKLHSDFSLDTCCEAVTCAYGYDFSPDYVRDRVRKLMAEAFPDGVWRVRSFRQEARDAKRKFKRLSRGMGCLDRRAA